MKRRERWIWQERKVDSSWALHVTAHKERRKIRADCELYADWLSPPSKLFRIMNVPITNPIALIRDCVGICDAYDHPFNKSDIDQIRTELQELLESFNY